MAKKPPVHILPRENGWAVVREGNDRATSVHQTQGEAAKEGRDIARRHETGFLLHGKDGQIREHNDYGRGQHPPEGESTDRATEGLAPGTQMLGEPTTNEEGQQVQRTTDEQGNIVETTFDEEGNVMDESPVGSVADLPGAEGYEETTDEEGSTKRIVTDESGTLIEVQIGPDGSVLDLQIPPSTEEVEETTRQVGQAARGAQEDTDGQTADQDATQQASGRAQNDRTGGATQQASDTAEQATKQAGQAAQDTVGQQARDAAGRKTASGGQDTGGQTTWQGERGRRQDEEQAEGQEPDATPAAKRKAEEMGVDLSRVEGTGTDGRIIAKDVTGPAGGAQEQEVGGDQQQNEEQGREAGGGERDAVGQMTGQAVQGVQDTTGRVTERARGLVGGLAGGGHQDEEKGRRGSQEAADQATDQPGQGARGAQEDTAERASGQAQDAAGGAAQQAQGTAGQATQRTDQEARQGGGHRQGSGGEEHDATDAAERKAGGVGVGSSQDEGSGARGRITDNGVKELSGPTEGGTAREQKKPGRAEQAAQGVWDTSGQTAEEAGGATEASSAAAGSAPGDADRPVGRSGRATDGDRGGGILDGRTDDAEEVRGMTDKGRDDDHFEMIGEGYADYEVYDQDGERLGKVDHLFLDEDDQLEYVGVETGLPGGRAVLIPAEVIPAEDERRRMVVSRPKSVVERGPTFGDQEEVTPGFEERVRSHYGLPSRPGTEDRSGQDALLIKGRTEREREVSGAAGSEMRVGDTETGTFREHDRELEGLRQPGSDLEDRDELRVRRSEEELRVVGTREREAGSLDVRKRVRIDREQVEVPTRREEVSVERVPVEAEASGTEIGDDEVRMPVTEEEVVVEKRPVVKEEIRIRKDVVDDVETVEEDVRREEVEIVDDTERGGRHGG